jgi:hypothetical protein
MPGKLWKLLKKHLPKQPKIRKPGRPPVNNRDVLDGIWHVLWTGCQWNRSKKNGSVFPAVSCMSAFRPGKPMVV